MREAGTQLIADIIRDAGGEVTGSNRLQKIAYLLDVAGYSDGFRFEFSSYSPYSDEVAEAAATAVLFGDISEEKFVADWGGIYSVYRTKPEDRGEIPPGRREFAKTAAHASAIVLYLAATAVYLSRDNCADPWAETSRRKPELANGQRLEEAKKLLESLSAIEVPNPLPLIA